MASSIQLPASANGYITPDVLQSLGLKLGSIAGGGTAYQDPQGNIYTFNGSAFVPAPAGSTFNSSNAVTASPSPNLGASPAPPPTNTLASGSSITVQPDAKGMVNGQYNPQGVTITQDANGMYTVFSPYYHSSSIISATDAAQQFPQQFPSTAAPAPASGSSNAGGGASGTSSGSIGGATGPNASVIGLPSLGPGSTGADVTTLQNWLVANGYMTQAQMNTGPGTYGPQTMAAVAQWQSANGINVPAGQSGYFGPISQTWLTNNSGTSGTGAGGAGGTSGGGTGGSGSSSLPSTGDSGMDAALQELETQIQGLASAGKLPPALQITPALTQQFLQWAQQVVSPQTQQTINQHITAINSNLNQMQTDYQNTAANTLQSAGVQLAGQDQSLGSTGFGMSGLRNLTDSNLQATTNRSLSGLGVDTANQIGQTLNAGAAQVGSSNASQFNVPSLSPYSFSLGGGSYGSTTTPGVGLNYLYNPSNYTVGTDVSTGYQNTAQQEANYLGSYNSLAANSNQGSTMSSIINQIPGLPQNYSIPASLM